MTLAQRFRLDLSATKKGANGMTALESVKISVSASDPAAWEAEVRKQLPAKVQALAKKAGRPLATSYDAAEILNLPRGPFRK